MINAVDGKVDAVLWDLDGVLVNTIPLHAECIRWAMKKRGMTFDYDFLLQCVGMRDFEVIAANVEHVGQSFSDEELLDLYQDKQDCYVTKVREGALTPYPGVRNWLEFFQSQGIAQAVASSTPRINVELSLHSMGIEGYFRAIVSGDDVQNAKPEPDIFLIAANRLDVLAERCLVVEDAVHGVAAANAAGMRCIAITNSQPAEALGGAHQVIASFSETTPQEILQKLARVV